MTVDIDKIPLVVLPANHLLFKEKKEVLEIANTNKNLKKILVSVAIISIGVIIANNYKKTQNERPEEN